MPWHARNSPFYVMFASVCMLALIDSLCRAQDVKLPADERVFNFGVTVVSSSWLKGDIYLLRPDAFGLPNFKKLKSIGSIYTPVLNLPPRNFLEGFPGITDRFEWFAIDYHGRFWITKPGKYRFSLESDDGAKLYIDSKAIINNDGLHPPTVLTGAAKLAIGIKDRKLKLPDWGALSPAQPLACDSPASDNGIFRQTTGIRPCLSIEYGAFLCCSFY